MDFGFLVIPGIIVGVLILLVIGLLSTWKKVPQDKAVVVTGLKKRVISGGGGIVVPLIERTDILPLENMKIDLAIDGALTEQGVSICADGVAVIKVKSDEESVYSAIEQFNTGNEERTIGVIQDTAKHVLEGKLREIISKMTVEEIYKDREKFASHVQEVAASGLATMGLEIKAFTIRDISDKHGYIESLGKKRIAEVKRDAEIAEAEAAKETKIKTAEAFREGEQARLIAETEIAEATKEKELKIQSFQKDQQTARATTDLAYEIQQNKVQKEVVDSQMQVEIERKEKENELKSREIELAKSEALRKAEELEASVKKIADAEKYRKEKDAEAQAYKDIKDAEARARAIEVEGKAQAEAKKVQGMAEVDIIREKGKAEAEAMAKKAEAFKQYNDAAVTQMIIEKLPEIAKHISEPLSKTEKIVIVDNGGEGKGASKIPGYAVDIMSKLPETMKALTGVDLNQILSKTLNGQDKQNNQTKTDKMPEFKDVNFKEM